MICHDLSSFTLIPKAIALPLRPPRATKRPGFIGVISTSSSKPLASTGRPFLLVTEVLADQNFSRKSQTNTCIFKREHDERHYGSRDGSKFPAKDSSWTELSLRLIKPSCPNFSPTFRSSCSIIRRKRERPCPGHTRRSGPGLHLLSFRS